MTITELLIISILLFLSSFIVHVKRRRQHPPGPLGLPFFGILPYRLLELIFSKKISDAKRFKENKAKYGAIWSVEIGGQRFVTLTTRQLITDAFIDNAELFSGRSHNSVYKIVSHGRGIIFIDGEMWHGHRQLALKSLKELGMGKKDLENGIINEVDDLISFLEGHSLDSVDMMNVLSKGVSNVISRLVFNHVNDYYDPNFEIYVQHFHQMAHSDVANRILSLSPFLFQTRLFRKLLPNVDRFLYSNKYCHDFVKNQCSLRIKDIITTADPECVFDYFHKYRFPSSSPVSVAEQRKEIVQSMYDLFNAGIDTTGNLLSFAFLFLGKHRDVQTDLRNEINELIEDGRRIDLDMRKKCPKMMSFIDEVYRFCSIVPKAHHRVLNDCMFHGYMLYSNDIIFADLVNIHSDPTLFENPEQFNAYRFTNPTRTEYHPSKSLIPFGTGKRSCIGESIAMMESFLFIEKIIHKFTITLPQEATDNFESIIEGYSGLIHAPLDHRITLVLNETIM